MCAFFGSASGYSPELHETMIARYCFGDAEACSRRKALDYMDHEDVPHDLLPSDGGRLKDILDRLLN